MGVFFPVVGNYDPKKTVVNLDRFYPQAAVSVNPSLLISKREKRKVKLGSCNKKLESQKDYGIKKSIPIRRRFYLFRFLFVPPGALHTTFFFPFFF